MPIGASSASIARRLLPVLSWFPAYQRAWLLPDVLAGLAVWAVMVPEGMAYAGIVGVPAIMGLYTIVPPLVAYALFGTSRLLVVGPDTATGLISALTVSAIAALGTAEFNALTSTLAILIGVFFLLFGVLRMGWMAAFIPTPVMRGFIEGLVCVTIIGQVPHLLGSSSTSGNFFTKLWFVLQHLRDAPLAPALTGLLSLTAMLLLRRLAPRIPAALLVVLVATILVGLFGGEGAGVSVIGDLPSGLPRLALPRLYAPERKSLSEVAGRSGCAGVKFRRREALCVERRGLGDEGRGAVWAGALRGSDRGDQPARGGPPFRDRPSDGSEDAVVLGAAWLPPQSAAGASEAGSVRGCHRPDPGRGSGAAGVSSGIHRSGFSSVCATSTAMAAA